MDSLKKITLATAALLATTAIVNAADMMIEPPVVEVIPEVTPVHAAGGWYLRGDVGYAHQSISHVDKIVAYVDPLDPNSVIYQHDNFRSADLDESWTIGGGVGYQVNDYFRVDATLRHSFDADFNGDSSLSGPGYLCSLIDGQADTDGDTCSTADSATFASTIVMANAYVDLGTFSGFTPYVGAGIGGAYTHWSAMNNDTSCDATSPGDCLSDAGLDYNTDFDSVHGSKNGWRFAYGLHAGASYDLSQNIKLDAGYSFTHIDGGDMFGFASGGAGVQGHHGDIKIHEVRAGLRYSFN